MAFGESRPDLGTAYRKRVAKDEPKSGGANLDPYRLSNTRDPGRLQQPTDQSYGQRLPVEGPAAESYSGAGIDPGRLVAGQTGYARDPNRLPAGQSGYELDPGRLTGAEQYVRQPLELPANIKWQLGQPAKDDGMALLLELYRNRNPWFDGKI